MSFVRMLAYAGLVHMQPGAFFTMTNLGIVARPLVLFVKKLWKMMIGILKKKLRKNISGQAWCTAKTQRFTVYHGQRPWCTVKTQRFTVHQERQKHIFRGFRPCFFSVFFAFFPNTWGKELWGIGGMGDGGTGWEMEEMRVRWRRGDGVGVLWSVVAPVPSPWPWVYLHWFPNFKLNSDINMKLS